ncbi:MAG: GIY-YIG nuclease family protein, partial [Pseudomonadota bacterium]
MHVISKVKNFPLPPNAILFSLDVVSLYTNIPHEEGIACCSRVFSRFPDLRRPDLTLLSILRVILTSNDFVFNRKRFLQTHGTAMGCAFGGSYASIFLSEWEENILNFDQAPTLWLRYIDDVLGVWPFSEKELFSFVESVNSLNPNIRVTLSFSCSSIRFLDLELYRNVNRFGYRTGFKPTDSFKVLTPESFHPPHVFKGIIFGHLYRFVTHSSSYVDFVNTKRFVEEHWRSQGYSRSLIRSCTKAVFSFTGQTPSQWGTGFFPCLSCKYCKYGFFTEHINDRLNAYPILHRMSCKDTCLIYLIECKRCHIRYVGESGRKLRTRISEHVHRILHRDPTSVAQHFSQTCSLADFSFTALERTANHTRRKKKEERWMRRLNSVAPDGLNVLGLNKKNIHLVMPFSQSSGRVARVCQDLASDVTPIASFTTAKNLRT